MYIYLFFSFQIEIIDQRACGETRPGPKLFSYSRSGDSLSPALLSTWSKPRRSASGMYRKYLGVLQISAASLPMLK